MSPRRRRRPGHPYLAGAPLLVAHRGGARLYPENTLLAFRSSAEVWDADMLELDVHLTGDGQVVVIHDETVDRTTDGSGAVEELTAAEIRSLDAAHRFPGLQGDFPYRGTGVRVPLFEEVLTAFPELRLNVEIKTRAAAAPLADLVRRHDASHRVLVAAAREGDRSPARPYAGPWGASARQIRLFWILHGLPLGWLYTPGCDVFQVPPSWKGKEVVTRDFVEEAHRRNLPVHVWTVDDPGEMRRLLDLGVDAIQTDRPDLLARVLVEDHGRPPPPGLTGADTSTPPDASARPPR